MKRLLLICMSLLFAMGSWAEGKGEPIPVNQEKDDPIDKRSLVIAPTASHDSNTIYVSSDIYVEAMQVTVEDLAGGLIYSNSITLFAGQYHSFVLGNVEEGEYIIRFSNSQGNFYGYFSIE